MGSTRAELLRNGAAAALALGIGSNALLRPAGARAGGAPYGPLGPADANGVRLPAGFSARLIGVTGREVGSTGLIWPLAPDGAATLPIGWLGLDADRELGGQRPAGWRLRRALLVERHAELRVQDSHGHEVELRRGPHPMGHVALVRGVPQRPRLGVRSVLARAGRRPSRSRLVRPRGSTCRPGDGVGLPHRGLVRRTALPLQADALRRPQRGSAAGREGLRHRGRDLGGRLVGLSVPGQGDDRLLAARGRMDPSARRLLRDDRRQARLGSRRGDASG